MLENIPPQCTDLYLYNNCVKEVKLSQSNKLMFLGLGNNKLADSELQQITQRCTELRCIDLCYNDLQDIQLVIASLKQLSLLKVLSLYGNPLSLLKHYYRVITKELSLAYLDDAKFVK